MRRLVPIVVFVLSVSVARADDKSKWTVDDVLLQETVSSFQISPDCKWVVWVRSAHDKKKGERVSHLVRTSLTEREEVELTRGEDSCTSPRWSPDGKRIAFLSSRPSPGGEAAEGEKKRRRDEDEDDKKHEQVWLMNPFGGEPWPLTEGKRDVHDFAWADDDRIVFTAQEDVSLHEKTEKDKKDTSIVVEDEKHEPAVRLFQVSTKTKKVKRLTDNTDRIAWFSLSPDGKKAVTFHERSLAFVYDNRIKPVVLLQDLETGEQKELFTERKFNVHQVIWTRDGKGFYVANDFTSHPAYVQATVTELYHYDIASGQLERIDLAWDRGLTAEFSDGQFLPGLHPTDDGFLALLADGARNRLARYRHAVGKWKREWITSDAVTSLFGRPVRDNRHVGNIFAAQLGEDGKTLVYAFSTASTPTQWFLSKLDGSHLGRSVQITNSNKHLDEKTIAKSEVVRWKGALDEEVEGILYYPHGYEAGKKYPLVVMIHGGPMGVDLDAWDESWAYPPNLMCQRGAFVLRPNYHGSSNYGLKFAESISEGKYYDLEVPDIEKGVDSLIAKGLVDPDRLGVLGWSNGGILTTALTVTTTRYKAAAAGAGDVDWISDWGNCEFGAAFDNYYLGKTPFEDPQLYIKKSPFYRLDRVRTPTIIFFGTEDKAVPTQQGWMHYRALQQLGKTEVRFLLFPGEKHSPQKLVHQRRKLTEELAWFDRHLFKTAKEGDESLKPGSPLDRLLKLKNAKRDGARYGIREKGILVPETVAHDGLTVGRFEVTRAQLAEFDKTYKVNPGQENLPASGVTFEQAKAYCEWLSKQTDDSYRLPTEDEVETLYEGGGEDENTLDAWAGYTLNPDDAARLRSKLKEIGRTGALLKEVGSYKGHGKDDPVFDLGGNVAEWVVMKDGKGKPMGGSADTPADERGTTQKPGAEYVGFRVIKGKK